MKSHIPLILFGHKHIISCVHFTPTGELIASGDFGGNLFVFSVSEASSNKFVNFELKVWSGKINDIQWLTEDTLCVVGDA